ncbi:MAG: energy transducer TonB [Pyrinomonadaceae bacterium]
MEYMAMRSIICLFLLSATALVVSAQQSSITAEAVFFDANPTVIKLPVPSYPAEAKKIGLAGIVSVKISVDETGKVTSADDADGPYPVCKAVIDLKVLAMRTASIDAAKKAKFKPAVVENKAVSVAGRINYFFESNVEPKVGAVGARVATYGADQSGGLTKLGTIDDSTTGARVEPKTTEDKTKSDKNSDNAQLPKTVGGGVLNGKATLLAKPKYPPAARAVRASGQVAVQVLIDEQGNMYSARAVNGHPLLRRGSEIAACDSRFSPTLLSGQPVKVSGIITYNYVP